VMADKPLISSVMTAHISALQHQTGTITLALTYSVCNALQV